jgi:hypothetical protein
MSVSRRLVLISAVLIGAPAIAFAQHLTLTLADHSVAVAPGEQADVPLVITNTGNTSSAEERLVITGGSDPYVFTQTSSGCGDIVPSTTLAPWYEFTIAPLPAGGSRTCNVRVDRPADAPDNVSIDWFINESQSWLQFEIGTFTDVGVTLTRVGATYGSDGTLRATYRLDAHNAGTVAVDDVLVQLGPVCVGTSLVVDMDLPGGCTRDEVGCGFTGGPAAAARMSLGAGASNSCLVRYTAPPGADTQIYGGRTGAMVDAATGGWIGDDDPDNDGLVFNIALGAPAPAQTPALSLWSMLVLALTLAAVAYGTRRRAG